MTLLFYTLACLVIGLTLFAFVRKPVLLQTMHPALNGVVTRLTSRRAKYAYLGFYYLFRALAKLALLFLSGVLAILTTRSDHEDDLSETRMDSDGGVWTRDTPLSGWHSASAVEQYSGPGD